MENAQIDPRIINGESEFIREFFDELKASPEYGKLKEQPFKDAESRLQLFNYLNMDGQGSGRLGVSTFQHIPALMATGPGDQLSMSS